MDNPLMTELAKKTPAFGMFVRALAIGTIPMVVLAWAWDVAHWTEAMMCLVPCAALVVLGTYLIVPEPHVPIIIDAPIVVVDTSTPAERAYRAASQLVSFDRTTLDRLATSALRRVRDHRDTEPKQAPPPHPIRRTNKRPA